MIKLYILYFMLGLYLFSESYVVWVFSFFGVSVITYAALVSSIILFSIASVLCLFRIKLGALIGFLCLIGVAPFAIYWLFYTDYTYIQDQGLIFDIVLGVAIILYIVAIFYSLTVLINYKKPVIVTRLKKPLKLFMVFIPIALLLLIVGLMIFNP